MPVIEAMHGGCPVIVSDTEIFRWVAGEAALFCDPYDVDSLVSCFYQLLNSQEVRQTLIEKGYENIKRFSSESVGPLWEQFIGEIVSHHSLEGANKLTLTPS